jgi:predicted transcriptional regulator
MGKSAKYRQLAIAQFGQQHSHEVAWIGLTSLSRGALLMNVCEFSESAYKANDAGIAMAMGELMLAHFRRIYQAFDGDLLQAMIIAEIAHYNVQDLVRGGNFRADEIAAFVAAHRMKRVNTLSLSVSCGIPRETLRRKIRTLVKAGLIQKTDDGYLQITEQCLKRFGPEFNKALLNDILTCHARLENLLNEH